MISRLVVVLALTGSAVAASGAAAAEVKCFTDWTEARQIVQREKLIDVPAVKEAFAKHSPAKILEIILCEEKGRYIYRLKVLEPAGRVRFHTFDARNPF